MNSVRKCTWGEEEFGQNQLILSLLIASLRDVFGLVPPIIVKHFLNLEDTDAEK